MNRPIRVLIVDDSALMRKAISLMLSYEPDIQVCGIARNGQEAIQKAQKLKPDIVTLDIEMPVMDGLTALPYIMRVHPVPVLMFSSSTTEGAEMTLDALSLGAVDFIPKSFPSALERPAEIRNQLIAKIKAIAGSHALLRKSPKESREKVYADKSLEPLQGRDLVLIGASTGGPQTLQKIIPLLPENFALPVLIIQHMPATFTKTLAERLNQSGPLPVHEAENGEPLAEKTVYVAPGGNHLFLKKRFDKVYIKVDEADRSIIFKPSVNIAAQSVAAIYEDRAIAVMLTGMGNDGLEGFKELKEKNAYVIAQSKESCVIYGMPRAVVEAGITNEVLPPTEIVSRLSKAGCREAFSQHLIH